MLVGVDENRVASPLRDRHGAISRASRPVAMAFAARSCERRANASWCSREMPYSAATESAVSGIESVPYNFRMAGLTNRQPMVVSWISACRAHGTAALRMTNGARVMLSTPPATTRSASPERTILAAMATASRPEPQSRLTVPPGTSTGRPASSVAIRATLRLSSPAWLAQPSRTSSIAPQSTDGSARLSARTTCAARSSGRTGAERAAVAAERGAHPGDQVGGAHDPDPDDARGAGTSGSCRWPSGQLGRTPPGAPASTAWPRPSRRGTPCISSKVNSARRA